VGLYMSLIIFSVVVDEGCKAKYYDEWVKIARADASRFNGLLCPLADKNSPTFNPLEKLPKFGGRFPSQEVSSSLANRMVN